MRRVVFGLAAASGLLGLAGVLALAALGSGIIGTGADERSDDGRERGADRRAAADGAESTAEGSGPPERIQWRRSQAVGEPSAGKLRRGVRLPEEGTVYFTWDPIRKERPDRSWRRWGTDRLVRTTLAVLREFATDNPEAPRVGVGDLSRPRGGDFGPRYGLPGHASHQNGLDADVYYPRLDRRERPPKRPAQVDLAYAQDLVDRFVDAGAEKLFVGPSLGLEGPSKVVIPLVNHDSHIHVRLPA